MRIETELKYDFDDVLIRPKRSTLTSRKDVDLYRIFKFRNGGSYYGIPIMAANEAALIKALKENEGNNVAVTIGTNQYNYEKLIRINKTLQPHYRVRNICVDVANGYTQAFVDFVKVVRKTFPSSNIIAGNVVTGEMAEGRRVAIPYKGPMEDIVQDILGGVRSACTYAGASKLKHLSKCATFVRCTKTHSKIYESNTLEI